MDQGRVAGLAAWIKGAKRACRRSPPASAGNEPLAALLPRSEIFFEICPLFKKGHSFLYADNPIHKQ